MQAAKAGNGRDRLFDQEDLPKEATFHKPLGPKQTALKAAMDNSGEEQKGGGRG